MGRLTAHTAPDGTLRQFVQDAAGSHLQTQTRAVNESAGGWFREGQQRGVRYVFDRAGELRQRRDVRHNGEKEDFSWGDNRQLVAVRKGERLVFKQTAEETRWFYWQGDALAGETVTITREPLAAQSIFDTGSRLQRQKAQETLFGSMREYVYYPGSFQPLALLTQEAGRKESWHYHCDPNGAPVRLTSLQGEIVWSEKTGVWGEKGEVYADRISNPLRFQGQYFDAETGLHYNRHRYYDPEIAGFISQDPIGLAGGLNVYQYAPNPLGWVDPWGLTCIPNKVNGDVREAKLLTRLQNIFGVENVISQRHLRNAQGKIVGLVDDEIKPGKTKGSRILDFVVKTKDGWKGIEVTSKTASKIAQSSKEEIIRSAGGGFVRHPVTKKLIELSDDISRIIRLD